MFDKFKPRKTEYRGVVFRSKSEACLAKYFTDHRIDWTYEPDGYMTEFYQPDFWVTFKDTNGRNPEFIVEYKPSEATLTYMEERADELIQFTKLNNIRFAVLSGSFFESEDVVPTKTYVFKRGTSNIEYVQNGWFSDNGRAEYYLRRAISKNRFDLRSMR